LPKENHTLWISSKESDIRIGPLDGFSNVKLARIQIATSKCGYIARIAKNVQSVARKSTKLAKLIISRFGKRRPVNRLLQRNYNDILVLSNESAFFEWLSGVTTSISSLRIY
jgi:hypothetical protein